MNRFVKEFNPKSTDVAVCGSMAHMTEWSNVIDELRADGLTVSTPDISEGKIDWSSLPDEEVIRRKGHLLRRHFANIAVAKAVLVCNYVKDDIDNYVGTNSLLEMEAGYLYEKPVYLLNPVPYQSSREEILAMEPIVLNGDIQSFITDVRGME